MPLLAFFKKRSTAIGVFILVVLVFSLLGCHLSLSRACRQAEEAFFDRSKLQVEGYYTCPGDQLEQSLKLANRLLSVIGSEGEWAAPYEALRAARLELDAALDRRDIPAIAAANQSLAEAVAAVESLHDAGASLPDSNDDYDAIVSDFASAQAVLDAPAYNEHILAFREDVLSRFPTNLLRRLTFVKAPETFP